MSTRIAFQGAPGAFGDEAARRWRRDAEPLPCATFADVLDAVRAALRRRGGAGAARGVTTSAELLR